MLRTKLFALLSLALAALPIVDCSANWGFIDTKEELEECSRNPKTIIVASPGRSGSSMLFSQLRYYNPADILFEVFKTHLLPPDVNFLGKCVFIFSNPDKSAESALYITLKNSDFSSAHFQHVETADMEWYTKILGKQTLEQNLLSYDGLGVAKHLDAWFHKFTECVSPEEAQIIAVKYENLWDADVVDALKKFLGYYHLGLPEKKARGAYDEEQVGFNEFQQAYNLGTKENPCYTAYDEARTLWEQAPAIQYLKIKEVKKELDQ